MTRKDYVALAEALRSSRPTDVYIGGVERTTAMVWLRSVEAIADMLARENPRFDRQRFVTACERANEYGA